jgi:hypothetical protein
MKVAIISSVVGNLPAMKECLDSWFPIPENWEVCLYKSKYTYVDKTSDYLDELVKNQRNVTVIEDGEHRGHVQALEVLLNNIKEKKFDWILHLDSDAKLLNREFYDWANKIMLEEKYKVWGMNHIRSSSQAEIKMKNDEKTYLLYLGRAHPWILLINMKFLIDNDLDFEDIRIDGVISNRNHRGLKVKKSDEIVGPGTKISVVGDTSWKIYTEATRFDLYHNIPAHIFKMWKHKNNQTCSWMRENNEIIKKLK